MGKNSNLAILGGLALFGILFLKKTDQFSDSGTLGGFSAGSNFTPSPMNEPLGIPDHEQTYARIPGSITPPSSGGSRSAYVSRIVYDRMNPYRSGPIIIPKATSSNTPLRIQAQAQAAVNLGLKPSAKNFYPVVSPGKASIIQSLLRRNY